MLNEYSNFESGSNFILLDSEDKEDDFSLLEDFDFLESSFAFSLYFIFSKSVLYILSLSSEICFLCKLSSDSSSFSLEFILFSYFFVFCFFSFKSFVLIKLFFIFLSFSPTLLIIVKLLFPSFEFLSL